MTETQTPEEITETDAGTWLDGRWGWHNGYRAVQSAVHYGFEIPEEYREGWDALMETDPIDHDMWCDINGDDGALVDKATEFLQEKAPEGFVFRWDAGDLSLLRDWADCAADGNGCVITGLDDEGNEVVQRCPYHTPDN